MGRHGTKKSSKDLSPEEHFPHLVSLLRMEETEEMRQYREEFLSRSPEERERIGTALLRLGVVEFHFNAAGHRLVSFAYDNDRPLPTASLDIGDVVAVSKNPLDLEDLPHGTVYDKDERRITLAFSRDLPEWVNPEGFYYLSRASSRSTFRRMHEAIKLTAAARHSRLAYLRDLSLGLKAPETFDTIKLEEISFFNSGLNDWQKEAVRMALQIRDVGLVHGPPGTGKTTVLLEIMRQAVRAGQFVFATAPSNTACDNLLEGMVKAGMRVIRLGHPARIMRHLRVHTLDFKLAAHPYAKTIDELETRRERLRTRRERYSLRLSGEEKAQIAGELRELAREIDVLDADIFSQVMNSAEVIVGTHTSALDPVLRDKVFDLLVMDEASQATEPSAWIPLQKARKVILAGDHFQLPPTVRSKDAEKQGLGKTLFERFHRILGPEYKTLLRIQYRMHEKIMNFSSREFYENGLVAHESVMAHKLSGLEGVLRAPETDEVFLFLDTVGRGFEEVWDGGSGSRSNPEEAELVVHHMEKLFALGVRGEQIGVITPYSAQGKVLRSLIKNPDVEVESVDAFQGREKEAVILSLVRSNTEGEMGFLTDTRRMNVAMTRARRKLVVIGDSATLGAIPFYRDFIHYAESIGAYHSSWEELA